MKNYVFDFDKMGSSKDAATKAVSRLFTKAGESVVQMSVASAVRRTSGISYREMNMTFADGQTVVFFIKQHGDIYKVKLNGRELPITAQDDQAKAIAEIVRAMDAGRSKFQAALAKVRVALPSSMRTAAPRMEVALQEKVKALDEAILVATEELAALS